MAVSCTFHNFPRGPSFGAVILNFSNFRKITHNFETTLCMPGSFSHSSSKIVHINNGHYAFGLLSNIGFYLYPYGLKNKDASNISIAWIDRHIGFN